MIAEHWPSACQLQMGKSAKLILMFMSLYFYVSPSIPLRFRTTDFPFLCMAYKIPPGHPVGVAIHIRNHSWRTVPMTTVGSSFTQLASWDDGTGADTIVDDDQ